MWKPNFEKSKDSGSANRQKDSTTKGTLQGGQLELKLPTAIMAEFHNVTEMHI